MASKYDDMPNFDCCWDKRTDGPYPIAWNKWRWINISVMGFCLGWTLAVLIVALLYPACYTIGTFYAAFAPQPVLGFGVDLTDFNPGFFLAIMPFTVFVTRLWFSIYHDKWFMWFMTRRMNYIRWVEIALGSAAHMFVMFVVLGVVDFLAAASMAVLSTVPIALYAAHEYVWSMRLDMLVESASKTIASERRTTTLTVFWAGLTYKSVPFGLIFFYLTSEWAPIPSLIKAAALGTLIYMIVLPFMVYCDYNARFHFKQYAWSEALYLGAYLAWGVYETILLQYFLAYNSCM